MSKALASLASLASIAAMMIFSCGTQPASAPGTPIATAKPAPLAIVTASLPVLEWVGHVFSQQAKATGGTPPYLWTAKGMLPPGVSFDSGGVFQGAPSTAGSYSISITAKDSGRQNPGANGQQTVTQALTIVISPVALKITTGALLPPATEEIAYPAVTLQATGGTPGYTWSVISGSLPQGLTLSAAGVISGTPTTFGTANFTIQVKDNTAPTPLVTSSPFQIVITASNLTITTTSLPGAVVGTPYSATLQATGGVPPYTWTITSGNLPAGLTLAPNGVISGTPTGTGTATFVVEVADSAGPLLQQRARMRVGKSE